MTQGMILPGSALTSAFCDPPSKRLRVSDRARSCQFNSEYEPQELEDDSKKHENSQEDLQPETNQLEHEEHENCPGHSENEYHNEEQCDKEDQECGEICDGCEERSELSTHGNGDKECEECEERLEEDGQCSEHSEHEQCDKEYQEDKKDHAQDEEERQEDHGPCEVISSDEECEECEDAEEPEEEEENQHILARLVHKQFEIACRSPQSRLPQDVELICNAQSRIPGQRRGDCFK